ncbi:Peptide transporter CstA [Candidatus Magnetaquicoccaceae bacterium FCR-1]|uniref:Peptide transporter CstA n=1 Tax=Candidatus Magnetaquiglobus chichijimensis TaxID=3141448 RepID=A0ABQ0C6I1_9PROT
MNPTATLPSTPLPQKLLFAGIAILGATAFASIALARGETVNATWLVIAALCIYALAYRFYALFIEKTVLKLDPDRPTPAVRHNDNKDFVPTNRIVLYGHHFAAIAGAGPLVGPVLAAQMGYLPGMLWILIGVVMAGAVQDFLILSFSMRRTGRSLGEIIRSEMGPIPGTIAMIGIFGIMTILLAVLSLIVVKAMAESPWSVFTVTMTIPIALFMGVYMKKLRPGRVGEVSAIGAALLILAIIAGGKVATHPTLAPLFTLTGPQVTAGLITYGALASIMPVWMMLCPRDYLSTFLKIGTIMLLAICVLLAAPELKMPATTRFLDGTGPVWSGDLFPFLFITIACGACSGFHALIASGTTPKMIASEGDARFIGYGGMLMESFVAIMALCAASILEPGIYFAMNSPGAVLGSSIDSAVTVIQGWGFVVTPEMIAQITRDVGEQSLLSRTGGAPTLAVGMAQLLSLFGGQGWMAFWYHFAILFEALFILTAVDTGTRACRFMVQDMFGVIFKPLARTSSWLSSIVATTIVVSAWGYILHQGVIDPFGGINSLWPLFGISNQMLAGCAMIVATVILFKLKRERLAWVTIIPATWLVISTMTASFQKVFSPNVKIGFLAHADKYQQALDQNQVIAPAKTLEQLARIVANDRLDAILALFFMSIVATMLVFGVLACRQALKNPHVTAKEDEPPSTVCNPVTRCC